MTALQLADRQDKINAALRKAIEAYRAAAKIAGGRQGRRVPLLQMATIYDQQLKDAKAAMQTWLEIVRQFSGTSVAEDACLADRPILRARRQVRRGGRCLPGFPAELPLQPQRRPAQFAIAENYEHLGQWVKAMDSYTNYLTNFPDGPLANKAKEQINWIKTYRL